MYVSVSLLLGMNARMDQERVDFMIGYIVQLIRNKWLWLLFPPPFFSPQHRYYHLLKSSHLINLFFITSTNCQLCVLQ